MASSGDLIDPTKFPVIDPGVVRAAARKIRTMGTQVELQVSDANSDWKRLRGPYKAPEQEIVYTHLDPAERSAEDIRDTLHSMSSELQSFADALGPIKTRMDGIRQDAVAFRDRVSGGVRQPGTYNRDGIQITESEVVPWYDDWGTVRENNQLHGRINEVAAELSQAEADCADAINALVTTMCFAAAPRATKADLNAAEELPWGVAGEYQAANCGESVALAVFDDFLLGTLEGLGSLVLGYDTTTGEWFQGDVYGQSWGGLGNFVGSVVLLPIALPTAIVGLATGTSNGFVDFMNDRVVVAGTVVAGFVNIDLTADDIFHRYKEDGVRAGLGSVLNVGSLFIPGGNVASAVGFTGKTGTAVNMLAAAVDNIIPGSSLLVKTLVNVGDDVVGLSDDVAKVTTAVGRATDDIARLGDDVGRVADDAATVSTDLFGDIGRVTDDVGRVSDDIGRVADDVGRVSDDIGRVADDVGRVSDDIGRGADDASRAVDDASRAADDAGQAADDAARAADDAGHAADDAAAATDEVADGRTQIERDGRVRDVPVDEAGNPLNAANGREVFYGSDDRLYYEMDGQPGQGKAVPYTEYPWKVSDSFDVRATLDDPIQHTPSAGYLDEGLRPYQEAIAHHLDNVETTDAILEDLGLTRGDVAAPGFEDALNSIEQDAIAAGDLDRLAEIAELRDALDSELLSRSGLRSPAEAAGLSAVLDNHAASGIETIVADATPGSGRIDAAGVSKSGDTWTFTVDEAKGTQYSPNLGGRHVDGEYVQQGSTPYLNDMFRVDDRIVEGLTDYAMRNEGFAEAWNAGKVDIEYRLVVAKPDGTVTIRTFVIDRSQLTLPRIP
ncbi:MAG TPA: hypothetical protein GX743_08035 [Actinomycetales bacterium]|nr:hypothetical protein [Actinomycetales bacterium]